MQAPPISLADAAAANGVSMIFATPLVMRDWPGSGALHDALCALITTTRQAGDSTGKSNVGGWHSPPGFIRGDAPALAVLRERIRSVMTDLTRQWMAPGDYMFAIDAWANVLGPGDYNSPHNHPNATWSGVYYVTGTPAASPTDSALSESALLLAGKIEFFDPRPAAGMFYAADNMLQRRCLFTPRPGCMLVFPSWLQHMVHPHRAAGERVSIAFNVTVTARVAA